MSAAPVSVDHHAVHRARSPDRLERQRPQSGSRVRVRLAPGDRREDRPHRGRARPEDATLERAAALGTAHELRVLDDYRRRFGAGVREIPAARSSDAAALAEAYASPVRPWPTDGRGRVPGGLRDRRVRRFRRLPRAGAGYGGTAARGRGSCRTQARAPRPRHRPHAARGIRRPARPPRRRALDEVQLLLGDGGTSTHASSTTAPGFRPAAYAPPRPHRRSPRRARRGRSGRAWGDPRGDLAVVACGRCATCEIEVVAHRDLLLVAGMRPVQRDRLRAGGIHTIDALADAPAARRA